MGAGRNVAVKLVDAAHADATSCLFREHEFLARLESPHVPNWYLNGRMKETYVLVTEWIEGPSLAEPGALEAARSHQKSLSDQLLEIEALLQQAGITHRDIRPKNLIVAADRLVLIDFGWSCKVNESSIFTPTELVQPNDRYAFEAIRNEVQAASIQTATIPSCHFRTSGR